MDWIKGCDGVSTTFDFPTKGILQVSKLSERNGSVPCGGHVLCRLHEALSTQMPSLVHANMIVGC